MVWSDKLYVGEGISLYYKAVIADIKIDRISVYKKEYVIVFPQTESNLLEMIPVKELELSYYHSVKLSAVGIAADKGEATELVRRIMDDVYNAQSDTDVRRFFKDTFI